MPQDGEDASCLSRDEETEVVAIDLSTTHAHYLIISRAPNDKHLHSEAGIGTFLGEHPPMPGVTLAGSGCRVASSRSRPILSTMPIWAKRVPR